jgi:acetyltransferase
MGAVAVDLRTDGDVERGFASVQTALSAAGFTGCSPLLVQKHVDHAVEILLGGRVDEQFGVVVTVGHGGVLANLLSRSVTRPAPVSRAEAEAMVSALPGHELFEGYRNQPPRDVEALIDAIVATSLLVTRLADEGMNFELDLNPLMLLPEGDGAVLADALLVKIG